jgi:hypothetical protein
VPARPVALARHDVGKQKDREHKKREQREACWTWWRSMFTSA